MSIPDEEILHAVRVWINYAEEDLNFAKYGLTMQGNRPYRLIAYHAQQCAEKYLKAYLVYHNIDFPYTHNIGKLLKLCESHTALIEELKDAESLTPYAITARYPGVEETVTENEAKQAISIASKVREVIREVLAGEGMTFMEEE